MQESAFVNAKLFELRVNGKAHPLFYSFVLP